MARSSTGFVLALPESMKFMLMNAPAAAATPTNAAPTINAIPMAVSPAAMILPNPVYASLLRRSCRKSRYHSYVIDSLAGAAAQDS